MNDRKHIERKLRRMAGMSAEHQAEMHRADETQPWRARCWKCRNWNTAIRSELKTCTHCGANLWSRDG